MAMEIDTQYIYILQLYTACGTAYWWYKPSTPSESTSKRCAAVSGVFPTLSVSHPILWTLAFRGDAENRPGFLTRNWLGKVAVFLKVMGNSTRKNKQLVMFQSFSGQKKVKKGGEPILSSTSRATFLDSHLRQRWLRRKRGIWKRMEIYRLENMVRER